MSHLHQLALVSMMVLGLLSGCGSDDPPPIPFGASGESHESKIDLARLEHELPLSDADLAKITPENLNNATQEQLDQIYARLTAGPIPDGAFDGEAIFPKGSSGKTRPAEIVGGRLKSFIANKATLTLEHVAEAIWKGKVFDRSRGILRNRINDFKILKLFLGGDTDSIEKIEVNGKDAWLLFPAKLYCGQSLLDSRRESIIIDYAFTDDLPGYREIPDKLAGREGLQIRDEIRMIRPGLYLGRAYIKKAFILNFVLSQKTSKGSEPAKEDCYIGQQRLTAMQKT